MNSGPSNDWKAFSLTYVAYHPDDPLSFLFALSSLAPLAILVGFCTLILFRRDLHTIFFLAGQVGNELINMMLKKWVKEPRPQILGYPLAHHGQYGWPSSHAQFVSFFAAYSIAFVYFRTASLNTNLICSPWKAVFSMGTSFSACFIIIGRVYLGHHSVSQVVWGTCFGLLFGLSWFITVHRALTPYFSWINSWSICEWLLIRDYTLIPNAINYEYACARAETRARSRKHSLHNLKRMQ